MADSRIPPNMKNDNPARADEATTDEALAGVIHDVNQMLTVITGRAGLLLRQADNAALKVHLQAIELAANDASAMLRRLPLSGAEEKIGAGAATIHEVAQQARLLVWPVDQPKYRWQNHLDRELVVALPAQLLREVLNNLLLNAVAAMPTGGEVVLRNLVSADKQSVVMRISDNGPGSPHENPEWVFGLGHSSHEAPGRGIGLAGCRRLISAAGGQMQAEAQSAGGATFVLTLPLPGLTEELASPAISSELAPAKLPSVVLVVDDEAAVREMLTDVLTARGCQVAAFCDAESARENYVTGAAQVALIDKNLPGRSGADLATELRQDDSQLGIILASGWRQESAAEADTTVIDFLADKPLAIPELQSLLQQAYALEQQRNKGNQ